MPKNKLRDKIKEKLQLQSKEERLRKSLEISKKLFYLKEFKEAKAVMFYVSKDGEVETRQMIMKALASGKKIVVPHINRRNKEMQACQIEDISRELCPGPYGIHQPREDFKKPLGLESIDMVIVPGVAFSQDGQRLGRGGGYFDRFLRQLPKKVFRVGLAFNFQIVESIPSFSHDESVNVVLSA